VPQVLRRAWQAQQTDHRWLAQELALWPEPQVLPQAWQAQRTDHRWLARELTREPEPQVVRALAGQQA